MIPRYTHREMGAIWSDEKRYQTWLDVELAATDALADVGLVPVEDARTLREKAAFDIARIDEIEQTTQHDIIAFTTAVAEKVGPAARWLHFGLTSSDVLDTALALQMRTACDVILADLDVLAESIRRRAEEHRRTPMIGRTHGVHAEPMTLGVKLALWYAEVARDRTRVSRAREVVSVGKISGAVGMFAHLDPPIEEAVCRRLGLAPAPVSSQVIQRDRHAELMTALAITAASLEKFATEIRGLQKTEIGEIEEPFGRGQKGSSAMPHKRNPVAAVAILGCTKQVPGLLATLTAASEQELQRAAGAWHAEWEPLTALLRLTGSASSWAAELLAGLVVDTSRMAANLAATKGLPLAEHVASLLAGVLGGAQAHDLVAEAGARAVGAGLPLSDVLLAVPKLEERLTAAGITPEQIDSALEPSGYLGSADAFITAALDAHRSGGIPYG
jgi:adenylosuccinate lyase